MIDTLTLSRDGHTATVRVGDVVPMTDGSRWYIALTDRTSLGVYLYLHKPGTGSGFTSFYSNGHACLGSGLPSIDIAALTRPTAPGDGLAGVVVTEDERNTLLIALQEHRSAAMRYATNFREDEAQFTEFRDTARRCSALIDRLLGHLE
jgi:hypothetical protein